MPTPILVPELGAGNQIIRVSSWLVDPGECVETGDGLIELLVKGVTFDVAATACGILQTVDRPVNSEVRSGETLGWLEERVDSHSLTDSAPSSGTSGARQSERQP